MYTFRTPAFIFSVVALGCGPGVEKGSGSGGGDGSGVETSATVADAATGEIDVSWAIGEFYGGWNTGSTVKPTLIVREDRTAYLALDVCGIGVNAEWTLAWEPVSEPELQFLPIEGGIMEWYGSELGAISMIRTEEHQDHSVMILSETHGDRGSTLGEFRRGMGCFVHFDPENPDCFDDVRIVSCG